LCKKIVTNTNLKAEDEGKMKFAKNLSQRFGKLRLALTVTITQNKYHRLFFVCWIVEHFYLVLEMQSIFAPVSFTS